jgi:tetratricopeptide (TPR) repeat protein
MRTLHEEGLIDISKQGVPGMFNQFAAVATAPSSTANNIISAAALPQPFSPQSRLGLPVRNLSFTGRVDELAAIARSLSQAQQGVIAKNVVGLGGVGKTQLVTEYVHQSIAKNKYAFIAWLDGAQPERAYRSLGEYLGLAFRSADLEAQYIAKVEQRLSAHYPSLLLVWDDAKDQGRMQAYLASAARLNAHCLITSRAQYWEEEANLSMIRLDVFNEADALTFLRQRFTASNGLFEEVAAKNLAHNVGYLPLALAQAAAYIVRQRQIYRQDYSLNDYLSAYTSAQVAMRKEFYDTALAVVQDNHTKTVWTTWHLSLVALRAENPQAVSLIELCAYLDAQEIQERLLSLLSDTPADEVQRSIEALLAYSLVERLMENRLPAIKIHQLLQAVIRLHLKEEPLPPAIPLSLPELEDATQEEDPIPEALMMRRYLTDKIKQWQWSQREEALNYPLSNSLLIPCELEAAHAQQESPPTALRKLVIPVLHNSRDHQIIALLLKQLQKAFRYDERCKEQLRAMQVLFAPHVKAVCDHALTAEIGEPNAARLLHRLGTLTHYLKNAKEMLEIYLRILPYYEFFFSNHPLLGKVLNNLGNAYGALGDHQEQKRLFQRALMIKEHHYGPVHVEVTSTLHNLAHAYSDLGDPKESKPLLQRALEIEEHYYGPEHVEVAHTLNNLANAYGALGDPKESKRLLERALMIQERDYGPNHVAVARTLNNLANANAALGDYKESKALLQRALKIEEHYYGLEHVEVACTLHNLANAYSDLGEPKESKCLLQRALVVQEHYYGPEHVAVARTLNNLAAAYDDLGEFPAAQDSYHRTLRIYQHFFGEAHPEVGAVFLNLAVLHFKQKELFLSLAYIKQAHAIFIEHPDCGSDHSYTQKATAQLKKLAPHLSKLEAQAQQCTGSQHTGDQAFQDKDYATAIKHWQVALPFMTVQSFLSPIKKFEAILLYERLGNAYCEQGRYAQALGCFTQAQTHLTYLREQQSEVYLRIASKKSACEIKGAEKAYTQRHALFGESTELTQKAKERLTLRREELANSTTYTPAVTLSHPGSIMPKPYDYALISQAIYSDSLSTEGSNRPIPEVQRKLHNQGWRLLALVTPASGYRGGIWVHEESKEMVLAHRGYQKINSWLTDLETMYRNQGGAFAIEAIALLKHPEVVGYRQSGYRLSTTGHSLGGFLAQVCLYFANRDDSPETYYPEMRAYVFDSPGAYDFLKLIESNLAAEQTRIDLDKLNVHNFCAEPTVVSTYGKQVGTLWHVCDADTDARRTKTIFDFVNAHKMYIILSRFDEDTGIPKKGLQMADWPKADYSEVDLSQLNVGNETLWLAFYAVNLLYKNIIRKAAGFQPETPSWYNQLRKHPGQVQASLTAKELEKDFATIIKNHYKPRPAISLPVFHFPIKIQELLISIKEITTGEAARVEEYWDQLKSERISNEDIKLLSNFELKVYGNIKTLELHSDYQINIFEYQQKLITFLSNTDKCRVILAKIKELQPQEATSTFPHEYCEYIATAVVNAEGALAIKVLSQSEREAYARDVDNSARRDAQSAKSHLSLQGMQSPLPIDAAANAGRNRNAMFSHPEDKRPEGAIAVPAQVLSLKKQ